MLAASRLALAACLVAAAPAAADERGWDRASDVGRAVVVAAALGVPAVQGDWEGDLQAIGAVAAAGGTTFLLKEAFPERRPDGSDRKSFPSAHTSESFAAAAVLEKRYGWKAGVPAFAVATVVGVSRVEARKHHWYDVAAGAALGTASGFLIASRRDARVRLTPWAEPGGGGLSLAARF